MIKNSMLNSILRILKQVTVEPFIFLFMFGYFTRLVSYQNILIERSCHLILNYSQNVCHHIDDNPKEQTVAVTLGNNLFTGSMILSTVPAFVVSMFLGPWSDIYGRRYTLILANSGILITAIIGVIITTSTTVTPYLYLAAELPAGLCGGMLVCLSSTYSYMSDITNERNRPTRFAILEFFFIIGMPLGTVIGGQAYVMGGYIAVMTVGMCGFITSLIWAIFMVKESKLRKENTTRKDICRDLFKFDNVEASFRTCTQKRPGNLRLQIWLLVLISCIHRFITVGSIGVVFSFAKKVFLWKVDEYSNIVTVFYALDALATVILVPAITQKFLLHEAALGLIGTFSLMAKMVLLSVAFKEGIFYYAWCSGILSPCTGIAIRSRMSKLVSKKELGRVYSLLATCESLTPVIGTIAMMQLFNAAIETYPGLPFAFSSALLLPSVFAFGWMTTLPTMSFSEYKEWEDFSKMRELKEVSSFS